jgi:hypothetical protein
MSVALNVLHLKLSSTPRTNFARGSAHHVRRTQHHCHQLFGAPRTRRAGSCSVHQTPSSHHESTTFVAPPSGASGTARRGRSLSLLALLARSTSPLPGSDLARHCFRWCSASLPFTALVDVRLPLLSSFGRNAVCLVSFCFSRGRPNVELRCSGDQSPERPGKCDTGSPRASTLPAFMRPPCPDCGGRMCAQRQRQTWSQKVYRDRDRVGRAPPTDGERQVWQVCSGAPGC